MQAVLSNPAYAFALSIPASALVGLLLRFVWRALRASKPERVVGERGNRLNERPAHGRKPAPPPPPPRKRGYPPCPPPPAPWGARPKPVVFPASSPPFVYTNETTTVTTTGDPLPEAIVPIQRPLPRKVEGAFIER